MDTLENLRAQRQDLNTALRDLSLERACAARVARSCTKRANAIWNVPESIMSDALRLYAHCEWDLQPAVTFLRKVGGLRRWPPLADVALNGMVEHAFLECELEALLTEPSDAKAQVVLKEWRLASFCINANRNGVAPTTAQLIQRATPLATDAPSILCKTTSQRPSRNARKWASRCLGRAQAEFCVEGNCLRQVSKTVGWSVWQGEIRFDHDARNNAAEGMFRKCFFLTSRAVAHVNFDAAFALG